MTVATKRKSTGKTATKATTGRSRGTNGSATRRSPILAQESSTSTEESLGTVQGRSKSTVRGGRRIGKTSKSGSGGKIRGNTTLIAEAIQAALPDLRGIRATELEPPENFLADKSLIYRQRKLFAARKMLGESFELEPKSIAARFGPKIRAWERARGMTTNNDLKHLDRAVRSLWDAVAIQFSNQSP